MSDFNSIKLMIIVIIISGIGALILTWREYKRDAKAFNSMHTSLNEIKTLMNEIKEDTRKLKDRGNKSR